MGASRKYDAIPSDRLVSEYDARRERRAAETEEDRYEVEMMRQQHARIVELLAQVRCVMDTVDQGWLYQQLANALGNFFEHAVDPIYRSRPKTLPDVDAERERLKLYGSDDMHIQDNRDARLLDGLGPDNLFAWERRNVSR